MEILSARKILKEEEQQQEEEEYNAILRFQYITLIIYDRFTNASLYT